MLRHSHGPLRSTFPTRKRLPCRFSKANPQCYGWSYFFRIKFEHMIWGTAWEKVSYCRTVACWVRCGYRSPTLKTKRHRNEIRYHYKYKHGLLFINTRRSTHIKIFHFGHEQFSFSMFPIRISDIYRLETRSWGQCFFLCRLRKKCSLHILTGQYQNNLRNIYLDCPRLVTWKWEKNTWRSYCRQYIIYWYCL